MQRNKKCKAKAKESGKGEMKKQNQKKQLKKKNQRKR